MAGHREFIRGGTPRVYSWHDTAGLFVAGHRGFIRGRTPRVYSWQDTTGLFMAGVNEKKIIKKIKLTKILINFN